MKNQNVLLENSDPADLPVSLGHHFLLSESNHRIANHLAILASAIGMRASDAARRSGDLDGEEVALILGEVGARISTVAWLHRFLSQQPSAGSLDINDHLFELCETLISALADPGRMALVKTGCGECLVAVGQVMPLCLLTTEVVTNSLKYAHPTGVSGTLKVGCHRAEDGSLLLEIADDGVGLPEGFDFLRDGATGARTVRVLARQLNAEVSFRSLPIGLTFRLVVPPAPGES